MSSPIPDAVLRHISGWGKGGIDHSLPFSPQAVARELLALRAAARALDRAMTEELLDWGQQRALRALLPKEGP